MTGEENWIFDVATSPHDSVKEGLIERRLSRVTISAKEYPDWRAASELAGCVAVAVHGGMPTSIRAVY